jgi:hypothetical protein
MDAFVSKPSIIEELLFNALFLGFGELKIGY